MLNVVTAKDPENAFERAKRLPSMPLTPEEQRLVDEAKEGPWTPGSEVRERVREIRRERENER